MFKITHLLYLSNPYNALKYFSIDNGFMTIPSECKTDV